MSCSIRLSLSALIVLVASAPSAMAENPPSKFVNVGMGGGGAMFTPACSPHDQNLMFVACDMGGVYRSVDGGKSWNMLDKRHLRDAIRQGQGSPVQFHPTDPNLLYAIGRGMLLISQDRGLTFAPVLPQPPWTGGAAAVCVNPVKPSQLLVGAGSGIYVSDDDGKNWTKSEGSTGRVIRFFVAAKDPAANGGTMFAGTTEGVFRSDDNGQTWRDASQGLPERELQGFCGGHEAKANRTALYCTVASKVVDGKLIGGIFRSLDGGQSWQTAMGRGLNLDVGKQDPYGLDELPQYRFIAMAENRPNVVYVTTRGTGSQPPHHFTVFRSDDFGDTWRHCFNPGANVEPGWAPVDLSWGWGGPAQGFNVCASNPDVVMFTNNGELYITRDAGKSWHSAYSHRVLSTGEPRRDEARSSRGLEVTTCWQVAFDPHDPKRAYICYTDIGFARSEDRGQTWRYSARGSPWRNTWYQIAFDPLRPGVVFGACSNHHDIPNYMELDPARQREPRRRGGGVCISEDYGASWRPLGQGLPEGSATSLVLDQNSPADRRTMYVAMFGHGVFKSVDSGATWQKASQGLSTENTHAYMVKLHPDGALFCTVTGKRSGTEFSGGSGLYRSLDGGQHWQCISPPLKWANGFDFDPRDSKTIYLAVSTAPRHPQGGLYKTVDGGASWRQVVKEGDLPRELHGFIHSFYVSLHPKNPNTVYFSTLTHGLFISEDAGSTWREVRGIPFTGVNRVTIDPLDENTIWLTTEGGGVWKGPARGL